MRIKIAEVVGENCSSIDDAANYIRPSIKNYKAAAPWSWILRVSKVSSRLS